MFVLYVANQLTCNIEVLTSLNVSVLSLGLLLTLIDGNGEIEVAILQRSWIKGVADTNFQLEERKEKDFSHNDT